ncbi:SAM-dependent methyltransferase [Pilimelia terevasa]|uniref:SAM-dependent methyltransferase n=1 Tax=Pilimelia terevasa TaxID=53372 RepID=A0A8J3BV28_9ACTN|nr:DNA adenine methylase [Pilimelia terevasa]GGK31977.1 SAM-dependent methyltransferase [Pilimelia terevasa]
MTVALRPPIPYFGGKITVGPAIAALLPAHAHYIEPYAGSLAVLGAKAPSRHETVNDLDEHLVAFFRVLRDRREELREVCRWTPHARAEYRDSRIDAMPADLPDLERARRVWVQLTQGRAGNLLATGWRHVVKPEGSSISMPAYLDGYVDRIAPFAERLRDVSLECLPALDLIAKYGQHPSVLLYVDPPYLGAVREARGYRHEMRDDVDHRQLAEALHGCHAAVVLSGYASDLYDRELYTGWDRHSIAASTGQGGTWANRTEVLWSNRPLGQQMSLLDALDVR